MNTTNQQQQSPRRSARLLQITDCHLGPRADYCLAGIHTLNSFNEVLGAALAAEDKPDLVLVTGDVAAHGAPEAYRFFLDKMAASGLPYLWLPGNHDDFALMAQLNAAAWQPISAFGNWRIITLNSAVPHRVGGRLEEDQLDLVARTLAEHPDNDFAIFLHHPPLDVGCRWLDRQQVSNGGELADILACHSNVRALFSGHVHQRAELLFEGIPFYSTPSTCFQFAPLREDFALDELPPGYRWIDLYDDGTLATEVVFLANSTEKVDTSTHGY